MLLDAVLAKHQLTQVILAKKLGVRQETISRWRGGEGLKKKHHDKLVEMLNAGPQQETQIEKINPPMQIPFSVTIPRNSLRVQVDKDGNINIRGMLLAILDNREDK